MSYSSLGSLYCVCFRQRSCPGANSPPDGPQHTFQDELLNKMAGRWKLTGMIRGKSVEHSVEAQWVVNHQFLQVHEKDVAAPPPYEANVMIG
jgi:hypothetical protein